MLGTRLAVQSWQYVKDRLQKFLDYRYRRVRSGQNEETKHVRLHHSVRQGYYFCIGLVSVILLLNTIGAIWAGTAHKVEAGLVVVLYRGSCNRTSVANFWIHLVINILSSSLFAASTYIAQRLAAPTREDVDRAHKDGDSLRIGSLAITNFSLLSWKRLVTFLVLWCSSLPIHLMYNSVIGQATADAELANYVFLIEESAVPYPQPNGGAFWQKNRTEIGFPVDLEDVKDLATLVAAQQPPLQRLDIPDCIRAYSSGSSVDMSDVFLVVDSNVDAGSAYFSSNFSAQVINPPGGSDYYIWGKSWEWLCGYSVSASCNPAQITANGTWLWDYNVLIDHCLARKLEKPCQINMSLAMMIAVLVCNLGKLCAMVMGMWLVDQPLITVGDAVASFLEREDETTRGLSIADCDHFRGFWDSASTSYLERERAKLMAQTEGSRRLQRLQRHALSTSTTPVPEITTDASFQGQYNNALSKAFERYSIMPRAIQQKSRSRFVCREMPAAYVWANLFGLTALFLACGLLGRTIQDSKAAYQYAGYSFSFQNIWDIGLGNQPPLVPYIHYAAASSPSTAYISGAIIANLPQLALSILYLFTNNLFTRLSMTYEFTRYATHRRGLRVSSRVPGSAQRGTYFLSFPLRYSLPLLAYFAITHTFLSESLFLRRSNTIWSTSFTDTTAIGETLVSQIGFSILGTFFLSILLFGLVAFTLGVGLWKRDWILPVTNGNSMSISAACYVSEDEQGIHLGKVRWGVTGVKMKEGEVTGHCAFSSRPVRMPKVDEKFL